jgi:hypothetical protein
MAWKLICFVLAASGLTMAQDASMRNALMGLPEFGVHLTGSPAAPILENRSGRAILGHSLISQDAAGHIQVSLRDVSGQLRSGKLGAPSTHATVGVYGSGPAVRIKLDAVVFEDGEVVGPDTMGLAAMMGASIQAERDIDALFLNGNMARLVQIAAGDNLLEPPDSIEKRGSRTYSAIQQKFAEELLRVQSMRGDEAAGRLASKNSVYPRIWRKETQ